ncbi:MAG TPA: zinc-binding alcohol dehydrogenase [Candidatus Methylacidiphilales bacterium]|jgi:2-desacetyl-2-hydroxyethyl bacteriochlorophyllide A dehydrogenase|nr:zinc-binding alcohol dehydrogenase [Candidatus Methylacidiphilales bacterium]
MNAQRLVFPARQKVLLEDFDPGTPGPGQVLVRTHLSLMSTGTENIVFNRLFEPGTHWDNWVKYPFYPGYAMVGVVEKMGEGVTSLKIGQRVAYRNGHRSHDVVDAGKCYPIPDNVAFERAAWFALAKITFHGAFGAGYSLGDTVLIIGAGPIGQMSIRWARAAGAASIIVVDTAVTRLPLAKAGGATAVVEISIAEAREGVLAAGHGRLPRVVIDSTGNAAVFAAALGLTRDFGKLVIMGDTGAPAQQKLTSDVIMRGLNIVGVHDSHNTAAWNEKTITHLFFELASSDRFPLEGLTSHVFTPADCAEAYATANRDRASTMGLLFDWAGELKGRK